MQSIQQQNPYISFGAAKDINLRYIMQKRSDLLPKRIYEAVTDILEHSESVSELPTLKKVHTDQYAPLMSADTLEQARARFSEFENVIDFSEIACRFSRSAKVIAKSLPIEDFSLDCLKKIWSGMPQEEITKSYGFSCRDVLIKLCNALNIPKPKGNYLTLLKASDEEGNALIAEKTREHLDVCRKNLVFANRANKTPEARAKHAESMRRFYDEHPERRLEVSLISKTAWDMCPHIKKAMTEFVWTQPPIVVAAITKRKNGVELSETESRLVHDFYKKFWATFPDMKIDFANAKILAAQKVKNKH